MTTILSATNPDAPINLSRDSANTDDTMITFTWEDGYNQGDTIIDYRVNSDQGTSDWTVVATGVLA